MSLPIEQLEQYTAIHLDEVLLLSAEVDGGSDEILVFRGYSSSTMRPTAVDLNVPVLSAEGKILSISRLKAPFNTQSPNYIEQNISWQDFVERFLSA
ncbi:MAG: hypothetical protein AB4040_02665 [Synechococcus sp.]